MGFETANGVEIRRDIDKDANSLLSTNASSHSSIPSSGEAPSTSGQDAFLQLSFGERKKSTNDLSPFQFARDDATSSESSMTFDPNGSLSISMIRRLAAPQSSMRRMSQSKIAAISMDRLQFSRLDFVGRNQEVHLLNTALERICQPVPRRSLISISGESGTGKSALAKQIAEKAFAKNAFFVTAKFGLKQISDEPYAGIKAALGELCHQMLDLPKTNQPKGSNGSRNCRCLPELRKVLVEGLHDDLNILLTLVPSLIDVVGNESIVSLVKTTSSGYKELSDRLKFAVRRLVEIVSKYCPLVWVCDDLQWADKASLDLLESCISDSENSALLLICCFRTNLVTENHMVSQAFESIERRLFGDRSIEISKIELHDLNKESSSELVAEVLSHDITDAATQALAEIVYRKTNGNAFYVIQFMQSLVHQRVLSFNVGLAKWTWDTEKIQLESSATDNVLDLMKQKLQSSEPGKEYLPIAACLGASFSLVNLSAVLEGFAKDKNNVPFYVRLFGKLPGLLDETMFAMLEEEGLVESRGGNLYSFVHDEVQEAALEYVPAFQLSELQYRIGQILLAELGADDLDHMTFVVVNLLNARLDLIPETADEGIKIAKLNHKAGRKAVASSAFQPAANYFQNAISLMPTDHWLRKEFYEMSLDLYSSVAECAFVNGDFETMQLYSSQVLSLSKSIMDKTRVCHVLMDASLADSGFKQVQECTNLGLSVLSELGCRFPRTTVGVGISTLWGLLKIQRTASRWTAEEIDTLPLSSDPIDVAVMRTLDKFTTAAYITRPDLLPLCIMKSVKRTFENGVTVHSPAAFALLSLIASFFLGDFRTGRMCAEHALSLVKKLNSPVTECRTVMSAYVLTLHWTTLFEGCREPLLKVYSVGMSSGDTESATYCLLYYLDLGWNIGQSLDSLDAEMSTYSTVMKEFKQMKNYQALCMNWQLVLNLRGITKHRTRLLGDVFDEDVYMQHYRDTKDVVFQSLIHRNKMYAACYFGEHEEGASLALTVGEEFLKNLPGQSACVLVTFANGLACYAMLRKTGQRKYRRMAKRCRKRIKEWVKKGNPNCLHYEAFLDAEHKACKGQKLAAVHDYKVAIRFAGRRGILHDHALANERLGEFLLECGDFEGANYRFEKAVALYSEWGAESKVELLKNKIKPSLPFEVYLATAKTSVLSLR